MYLIHGFFCQEYRSLAINLVAGEGVIPFVREDFIQVMFAGRILQDFNGKEHIFSGEIQDVFGRAQLSDILFSPTKGELSFVKEYVKSCGDSPVFEPGISYALHREQNGTWIGEYTVPEPDGFKGPVRCVIIEVDEKLFADDLKKFAAENGPCERESSP